MNDSPNRKKLNRVSRVDSKTETIEIKYLCNACRCDSPEELTEVLLALQDDFGGNRIPLLYGAGSDSVEISIPVIQLVVTFVLYPFIKKYLDGLLNGDSFKDLGEAHRHEIMMWLSKTEKELSDLFLTIKTLTRKYPHAINRNQKETNLVTLVKLGDKNIRLKLNDCSASAIEILPDGILKAIIYAVKTEELGDVKNFEIRFESVSHKWLLTYSSGAIKIDFNGDYFNT